MVVDVWMAIVVSIEHDDKLRWLCYCKSNPRDKLEAVKDLTCPRWLCCDSGKWPP